MCYICFTNRDIMVNLYKLNKKFVLHLFSMLPFFLSTKQKIFHPFTFPPSQPNKMRENKISSIHSLFHPLFIFYLSSFPFYRPNASLSFKRMLLKRMKDDYSVFFRLFPISRNWFNQNWSLVVMSGKMLPSLDLS